MILGVKTVIRLLLMFTLLNGLSINVLGQKSTVMGSYVDINSGIEWKFTSDSFRSTSYENHGKTKLIKEGAIILSNDTLRLFFYPKQRTNSYKVLKRRDLESIKQGESTSILKIKVLDSSDKPISGAILSLLDFRKRPSISFLSDSEGRIPEFTLSDENIGFIKVTYIASQSVVLPISGFRNAAVEMNIILDSDSEVYYQGLEMKEYLLSVEDNNRATLTSLNGGPDILLSKNGGQ